MLDLKNEIPTHILNHLLNNESFCRRVVPFLKKDYFEGPHKVVFNLIVDFVDSHNKLPTSQILNMELRKVNGPDDLLTQSNDLIQEITVKSDVDTDYLIKESEKWCRDRAIYLALVESIGIADGQSKDKNPDAIPSILSDALAVSFDNHVGHDYLLDYEERYESYHRKENRIPFDLEYFNKITKGGLPNKTLNIALAGTGVGKSLFMCHMASSALFAGKNVLYITLEMAEEKIAERIDANLLNVNIQDMS